MVYPSASRLPALLFTTGAAVGVALLAGLVPAEALTLPLAWIWVATIACGALAVHELLGRPVPFLRWSVLRMAIGMRKLTTEWQVGDGREEAAARYVVGNSPPGDVDAAIAALDAFAYRHKFLMNVGDEKGAILDQVVRRVQPRRAMEVGAYVGYSALRIARLLPPGGHLYSVELSPANAAIARRILEHAGVADRVTFVVGSLGDAGPTLAALRERHGLGPGSVDLVFLDHDKGHYLPDLQRLVEGGFLHPGSVVVADNVGFPGAPAYRRHMAEEEGRRWRTREHRCRVEYQAVIPDLVLESTLLDGAEASPRT